jgi:biotin transport system permease protein
MLTLTSPVETALHRWPAAVKLAGLAGLTLGIFALPLAGLAVALAAEVAIALACGAGFAGPWARMFRPLWPFALLVAVWHLWLGAPAEGLAVILRMAAAVGAANLVTMTTKATDMQAVIERLAQPLGRIGLSPKVLGLAFALVVRFIPVMLLRMEDLRRAWAARSPRRAGWRIVFPATLAALDDAEHVADALRARGGLG